MWKEGGSAGFLFQISGPKRGLASRARIVRVWQFTLLPGQRIGGFNVGLLASFGCSARGQSTTYVGVKTSDHCKYAGYRSEGAFDDLVWNLDLDSFLGFCHM